MNRLKRRRLMRVIAEKPKKEKSLKVMVGCQPVEIIKMIINDNETIAESNIIQPRRHFLMTPNEAEAKIHRDIFTRYQNKYVSIVYS